MRLIFKNYNFQLIGIQLGHLPMCPFLIYVGTLTIATNSQFLRMKIEIHYNHPITTYLQFSESSYYYLIVDTIPIHQSKCQLKCHIVHHN